MLNTILKAHILAALVLLSLSCANPSNNTSQFPDRSRVPDISIGESQPSRITPRTSTQSINQLMPRINESIRLNPYEQKPINGQLGLDGVRAATAANNKPLALSIAERTNPDTLRGELYAEFLIERLQLLQHENQHQKVVDQLSESNFLNRQQLFAAEQSYHVSALEAASLEQLGQFLEAAKIRFELSESRNSRSVRNSRALLADPLSPRYQREQLWHNLLQMDHAELEAARQREKQAGLRAWMELAEIVRNPRLNAQEQANEYYRWRDAWQRNALPIQIEPPRELEVLPTLAQKRTEHIAVLLPLSGKLASAGNAIRDGMIAASLESNSDFLLRFYDTASQNIVELAGLAQSNGADIIVGPLQKNKVRELIQARTNIPVLTLNYLPDGTAPPINMTQFGLAGEDEASQLASLTKKAGHKTVLIVHSDKDWAIRSAKKFESMWADRKRVTIRKQLSDEKNYNDEIAAALNIDQSKQRKQRLQSLMGENFEFQTRRRKDIDAIVVFANAKQLSAIKPLLSYHYAGRLPVLTSSKINSARSKAELRDVNGVIFSDAPFLLDQGKFAGDTRNHYKGNTQLTRLFAMGMDAYFLAPKLELLQRIEQGSVSGRTGALSLTSNRIERELDNAIVRSSKITPLNTEAIIAYLKDK